MECVKGEWQEKPCDGRYKYDYAIDLCVKSKITTCDAVAVPEDLQPVEPESEESEDEYLRYNLCNHAIFGVQYHPAECDKYIVCKNEKVHVKKCAEGYIFHDFEHVCVKGNKKMCCIQVEEPSTTQASTVAPTTEAEEKDSEESKESENASTVAEPPTTEGSETPELTPPGTGGDPLVPIVDCVEGFTGYLPIENDCNKYVYCFQGEPGVKTCLDDYIYYHPFKDCLPGDSSRCQLYSV
ncbi:hypothetical protein ZHAS_00005969 [Anopheles sinensis]|uniref:Chitin-binding type-2 domain-containing protein n=1 Tax=Anopheles sinensis TaxID=74873 RepID=A0A084VKU9_ANOSI|nr:hypothetical protein ZHAS_00005969 [Anopheles sinensis]